MKCVRCGVENPAESRFCGNCSAPLRSFQQPSHLEGTLQITILEFAVGDVFARRYKILEPLGRGGMGRVYKAYDQELQEILALKLLNQALSDDENIIERFRGELRLARQITHKNVCRMFDLGQEAGQYFITMEYVAGEDLKSMIRMMGRLSEGQAVAIARQVCEGLAEAHRLGIIHRDLKPQNLMIDKESRVRIMDFGIARSLTAKGLTEPRVAIGTPEYMSPEQVEGKAVDPRSDLYALGVVLFEMVTGQVPFQGETPFSVALKHKTDTPPPPRQINSRISDGLEALILKCLEKNPDRRYQTSGELAAALGRLEQEFSSTERALPLEKNIRPGKISALLGRKKTLIAAAVVILLAAVFLVGRGLLRRGGGAGGAGLPSVAVVSFDNQSNDKTYDYLREAIPNLLITSLEQSGEVRVTSWERMFDLLRQLGKGEATEIDREAGFEISRLEGSDAVIAGSFSKADNVFVTDVKILDVKTKEVLGTARAQGADAASILKKQVDELSEQIWRKVSRSPRKRDASPGKVMDVTTDSLEAYNYFLRGREDFEKSYFTDAEKFLKKAVALDEKFAAAYLYLARSYYELDNIKARNDSLEKALLHSGRAMEKERLQIESAYAWLIEKNGKKCIAILNKLAAKYPRDKFAHQSLGQALNREGFRDDALRETEKAIELDPSFGEALNQAGYIHAAKNELENALEYFRKYSGVSPGDANPLDSMAEMYLLMGNLDQSIAKYKEALEVKPDFNEANWRLSYVSAQREDFSEALRWVDNFIRQAPNSGKRAEGIFWRGLYRYYLGQSASALTDFGEVSKQAGEVESEVFNALSEWMTGWISFERGKPELGRQGFQKWFDIYKKISGNDALAFEAELNFYLALIDLKGNALDSAKAGLKAVEERLPKIDILERPRIEFCVRILHAEILLAEGSAVEAIAILRKADPPKMPSFGWGTQNIFFYNVPFRKDGLARAYLKIGDATNAIAEYERLLSFAPERKERFIRYPRYHYDLARLYEEQGLKDKARERYQRFLFLWENADPGLPEFVDAKKRFETLSKS
jgi:tetratricopeptide (TPR) repeat protein